MAESDIEKELEAIRTVAGVLKPLGKKARQRVLQYAVQHFELQSEQADQLPENKGAQTEQPTQPPQQKVVDIRSLRDQKRPNSDMEMAAIVAYYLRELAPEENKKDAIVTKDITKYFNQAGYPLPTGPQFTLPNAKAAGYFENAGRGKYRLNPVGYNLVAYGLPRAKGESTSTSPRKKRKKKKTR